MKMISFHSQMSILRFLLLVLSLGFATSITINNETSAHRNLATNPLCPWDTASLQKLIDQNHLPFPSQDISTECQYMLQGIRLLRSDYLRTNGSFSLPPNVLDACWDSYEDLVHQFIPGFQIKSSCGYKTNFISNTCMNITSRSDFENLVPAFQLQQIKSSCDQSLKNDSACASCVDSLNSVRSSYFEGSGDGNVSDCKGYPYIYAAAFANRFGPDDIGTAKCVFLLDFSSASRKSKNPRAVMWGILSGCVDGFVGAVVVVWLLWVWHKKWRKRRRDSLARVEVQPDVESGTNSSSLKFSFEEIRKATGNFSRENIVGMGAYGNVYKGVLPDGSEVALKRFKNCSAAGDEVFAHEVEVIASVRHVNLVALRGYCTATVPMEGHQRIIACDLMRNGSLYQHLFQPGFKKLTWSIRQKIALGVARGLAYLHYGVHPAIIHRDIKASNVLLDEAFEAKLADFGLAKFTPEGQTHMSTSVAGTLGYVAPEYALYGQLSERIDVYSFGVVLLELLSGKKAVVEVLDDNRPLLLADWAWSQVREGGALGVIEEGMPELGVPEVMEKYVLVAVLCSHPIPYARPTMDHIVKILENDDTPVPSIQGRPFSLLAQMDDTERSSRS
ncbi:PREDICTED: probable LRR receptor-like serine/threonine-protein kinase RKF3 [Fragaria vesca subsp. vesca]|uniref:probable LRR receptor-like serine/threonine-protein kinase RKF3 n=1 Tax=Fragaria vesca subsp. vesca TaxID=101020 RepID=UPI0002C31CF0|nr:PREDICTED: probable LRR receptor-like serine/threonine-protein kinase RKF3 [Fragaria vesca subsp. vesca]